MWATHGMLGRSLQPRSGVRPVAKKTSGAKKVATTATRVRKLSKAVRLDLSPKDHERLERCAEARGLNLASYARMALLALVKADEEGQDS